MKLQRREWLAAGGGALLSGWTSWHAGAAQSKEPLSRAAGMHPIVDTHQHLWDLQTQKLPWLGDAPKVLQKSYLTADYLKATEGLKVRAIYMEVDVAVEQQTAEARRVLELCRSDSNPTEAAVISGRPGEEGFAKYLAQFADDKEIKGVRQVLHNPSAPAGLCLQSTFVASVRLLGEQGRSFDLCMRPTELEDGVKLAERCPDTRLIIDHCGNADIAAFQSAPKTKPEHDADAWRRSIERLASKPNTICKISGIVAAAPEGWKADMMAPIVNHCLDAFGPDRVVFGGDWPVCRIAATYRQWFDALAEIIASRSEQDRRKLLHDNAVRIYGL